MIDSEIQSSSFKLEELRSERTRVRALLGVFAGLLVLVLIRGAASLAEGRRGEAWPFVLLLAVLTLYEMLWLRFIRRAIDASRMVSRRAWTANQLVESLAPTVALLLQIHSSFFGPHRALMSPVAAGYFLFIILSTLHLDPILSRLAGMFSAIGYAAIAIYVFTRFPDTISGETLLLYSSAFSYAALLLVAGFAAAVVAQQIRLHVIAALHEAETKAKIAQFEHDLGIARSIQQGLLPKAPPSIQNFDVAGWNQPADETGGDYFDWQELADGRVALTIADATGHGIGPALVMSACRAYTRAGFATETDLRNFLIRLNRLLYEDLPPEKFVTLAAGLLDPQRGVLNLISAGHGPLLFYSAAEDRFREVDVQGPPLGLLPRAAYGCAQLLEFAPGDMLVLVTDGFIEWANKGEEDFGVDRVQDVVRAHRSKPSATIISELHSAIVQFVGSMPQNDDLTAVIVKRQR